MSRQYYGIESLNLTTAQRQTRVDALQQLGANTHPNPSHRNHWRVRLNNLAVIFEAEFNDEDWTVSAIRTQLANIFGVNVSQVTVTTTSSAYGPLVMLAYNSSNRLRMTAFGGLLAIWTESHALALDYLMANLAEWGAIGA